MRFLDGFIFMPCSHLHFCIILWHYGNQVWNMSKPSESESYVLSHSGHIRLFWESIQERNLKTKSFGTSMYTVPQEGTSTLNSSDMPFFLLFDVWGSVSFCVRKNAVVLTLGFERRIAFMSSYNWVISLVFWSRFFSHSSANDGRTKALVLYLHIQCWFLGFITRISLLVAWRNCECLAWKEGLAQYIDLEFMTCMISDVWVSVT